MACQESFTLYKKAEIEGYLDKINTGITARWLSGKTRTWCELFGTTLYMFKDSKRASAGSAGSAGLAGSQQMDLTQVHMVRKVNNDKLSAQFEILTKNKQHIFGASSVTECDNWIRHLQAAMTMKDQESASEQRRSEFFISDYKTIAVSPNDKTDTAPGVNADDANTAEPAYSEVDFPKPPDQSSSQLSGPATTAAAVSSHIAESEEDAAYCTVELRRSSSSQPAVPQVKKTGDSNLQGNPTPTPSTQERPVIEEDSQGYVKVEMRKKSFTELPVPLRESEKKETESKNEDCYTYATVKKRATPPENKNGKPDNSAKALADGTPKVSSDEEDVLIAASQRDPDPIPPLPHPLEPADLEPLAALQEFLSNNRKLCRPSFSERAVTDDPVADVKRLLEELCL